MQNLANIGRSSFSIWVQSVVDGIANNDDTGIVTADLGDTPRRRAFGECCSKERSSNAYGWLYSYM